MDKEIGLGQNTCVSTCASTCEKSIYESNKIKPEQEAGSVIKSSYDQHISTNDAFSAREINLENILNQHQTQPETTRMVKEFPSGGLLQPSDYLRLIESRIPKELISSQCFEEIKNLSGNFSGNLTSFFGFECRLGESEARADWAFAVSGMGKDRHVLAGLLQNGDLPRQFLQQPEWRHVNDFAAEWANLNSILYKRIKCVWLEFDISTSMPEIPIPCVFFGPAKPPEGISPDDTSQYGWLTKNALPLLKGRSLSKMVERKLLNCIRHIPKNASLFQVGIVLSRSKNGVRLYINRLYPQQIISYLKTIGWSDETGEFESLIEEISDKADRFVLSFDVCKDSIGPRIGIECSFTSNLYQQETRWNTLLNYLVEKGLCLPEKRDALLSYPGMENEENFSGGIMKPLISVSTNIDNFASSTIVRYINHIKIVYKPGHPLEAKAYPAVRLFELSNEQKTRLIME